MKLQKKLKVNNQDYLIVSDNIVLDLFSPGRGVIVVQSEKPLQGIYQYFLGYNGEYVLYMTGYIEACVQMDVKQQRLNVKELSSIMSMRMPISLRHPTIKQVISYLSGISGIEFILENADWNLSSIPNCINVGSGYELLDWIGKELKINKYIWNCQPDGKIYIGSWNGSKFGQVLMEIPSQLTTQSSITGATIPIIPQYRPGLNVKFGANQQTIITSIEISSTDMRLKWNNNPWV